MHVPKVCMLCSPSSHFSKGGENREKNPSFHLCTRSIALSNNRHFALALPKTQGILPIVNSPALAPLPPFHPRIPYSNDAKSRMTTSLAVFPIRAEFV